MRYWLDNIDFFQGFSLGLTAGASELQLGRATQLDLLKQNRTITTMNLDTHTS
jgi:hypothetical protein